MRTTCRLSTWTHSLSAYPIVLTTACDPLITAERFLCMRLRTSISGTRLRYRYFLECPTTTRRLVLYSLERDITIIFILTLWPGTQKQRQTESQAPLCSPSSYPQSSSSLSSSSYSCRSEDLAGTASKLNPNSALVLPRLGHGRDDFTIIKEQRMKNRLEEINATIRTQNYYDWLASQKEQGSRLQDTADTLW
jgi:hypothetical protein